MEDNGYGFEIYYLGENKYSILGGTNRGKTFEEIRKDQYSMQEILDILTTIVTLDGLPTNIIIINMGYYNLENMSNDDITKITDHCKSLGQRPTKHGPSYGQYKAFNVDTKKFHVPGENTGLIVRVEQHVTPKDPMSNLKNLIKTAVQVYKSTQ